VVHCAAKVQDWGSLASFYRANVDGTRSVLNTFESSPRFIHISSASVYDLHTARRPLTEQSPVLRRFVSAYARTKLLAERAVQQSGRRSVILRPHAVYGPHDTTLLPRLLRARLFGVQLAVGSGKNRISLTHVRNLAQAVGCALEGEFDFEVFNVADGDAETVDSVLRALLQALGAPPDVLYLPTKLAWMSATILEGGFRLGRLRRSPMLTRYAVEQMALDSSLGIEKARRTLGYKPVYGYRESLAEALATCR